MVRLFVNHRVADYTIWKRGYDEAEGLPAEGIAAGTRWADVPADWTCPDCSAGKDGFEKLEF